MTPDFIYNTRDLYRPACYGWYRKPCYLYIGMSLCWIERIATHETLKRAMVYDREDGLHVWHSSSDNLSKLELRLITHYRPYFNALTPSHRHVDPDMLVHFPRFLALRQRLLDLRSCAPDLCGTCMPRLDVRFVSHKHFTTTLDAVDSILSAWLQNNPPS